MVTPVTEPGLSVVIPVYNSEQSLPILLDQLALLLSSLNTAYEAILINDGSRDQSWAVICRLADQFPWLRGVNLMRNFGQHNALLCGIRMARYATLVTMDDDLQHPPSEIPKLLAKLVEGYDVVYGVPHQLPHSLWRNLSSRVTKRIMANAMGISTIRDINAFRALRTDLRKAFADYQSPTLLLDVLLSWGTVRFTSIPVEHRPRPIGKSNYNFRRLFNQALLILTGFSTGPLRMASMVGFAFTCFGLLVLLYVLWVFFFVGSIPGFPFLASIITLFSGVQLFVLGIIGEYLARMYSRTIERPTYVVDQVLNGDHE